MFDVFGNVLCTECSAKMSPILFAAEDAILPPLPASRYPAQVKVGLTCWRMEIFPHSLQLFSTEYLHLHTNKHCKIATLKKN